LLSHTGLRRLSVAGFLILFAGVLVCAGDTPKKPAAKSATTQIKKPSQSKKVSRSQHHGKRPKKTAASWRKRGQQNIDSERAKQIQTALIRDHYLDGEPSGVWDAESQKAMERYQADNGWQSKSVPDSRALIKLGLGPGHEHLLNPETSMIGGQSSSTSAPAVSTPAVPAADPGSNPPQKQ